MKERKKEALVFSLRGILCPEAHTGPTKNKNSSMRSNGYDEFSKSNMLYYTQERQNLDAKETVMNGGGDHHTSTFKLHYK